MSGTKVSIKYGFGKPQAGSLKKAELAIDLKDLSLWTTESDGGQAVRVGHDTTDIENDIEQINIDINANANAINQLDKDAVKKNVSTMQEMIGNLKALGFIGDGSGLTGITAGQLDDVDTTAAKRDDFLIYNGTTWVAEDFHLDTELTYQGGIALASPAPAGPANGDLYINNADGVVHPSWTGIAGETVKAGNVVGWAANKARWFLLGDIASSSVTDVEGGLGISIDDSKPAEPIVSIDRVETNKWYEPVFSKNTAFNKAFGTTAGTVADGGHLHAGVYQPVGSYAASNHNHSGVYQPVGDYALKSYSYSKAESDAKYELKGGGASNETLQSVTNRGSSTNQSISVAGLTTSKSTTCGSAYSDKHRFTGNLYVGYTPTGTLPDNSSQVPGTMFLGRGVIVGRGSALNDASIGMENNVIFDLGNPQGDTHAVSKKWVKANTRLETHSIAQAFCEILDCVKDAQDFQEFKTLLDKKREYFEKERATEEELQRCIDDTKVDPNWKPPF
jgi:hypothetical protein